MRKTIGLLDGGDRLLSGEYQGNYRVIQEAAQRQGLLMAA